MDAGQRAWASDDDAETMLRTADAIGVDRRALAKASCACARVALVHVDGALARDLSDSIATIEAWARGRGRKTPHSAAAEIGRHMPLAETDIVGSVVGAAHNALTGGYAATYAANAAYYAAEAARAPRALCVAARHEVLRRLAPVVRKHIPWALMAKAHAAQP